MLAFVGIKNARTAVMGYLYETHSHTCEASACGKVHGEDYISYMMDRATAE